MDVTWNGGGHTSEARYSDLRYASSADEERRPNLALGRIIGNNAQQLAKVIQTSISVYEGQYGYGFGRDSAMLLSGTGTAASFAPTVDEIQTILQPEFSVDKLHWWEYFDQSAFARDYEQYDGFAAGDVDGDGDDEIIVGDRGDTIYVLNASGGVVGSFARDFEEGDGLAAGDVNGDGQDEIIIGDRNDHIVTYNESGTQLATFERDYEAFDGLAVGDVDCGGADEIVMADRNDHIYVFAMNGAILHEFYLDYEAHDGLGVGDVQGSCNGEIIIGDRSQDKIHVYERDGSLFASFDYDFAEGYGLAVGNVRGDAYDDIVIGNIDDRRLHVYSYISGDGAFKDKLSMDAAFDSFDGLAVGNVLPGSTELEMLVADRSDQLRIYDLDYCSRMMGAFTPMSQDKDVIYFSGHGNTNIWGPCLVSSNTPSDFGSKNPFVLATSCLTGNYKDGDNYSIAEAFLQGSAGVYVGSTEVSAIGKNNEAGKWFFNNWDTYDTVGRTFTDLRRDKFDDGEVWRLWVYSYNLYGDPKYMPRYGRAPSGGSGQAALDALGASLDPAGLRTIEVHIPDFEVNTVDGWDHVEIPGGELWSEAGDSEVPYWTVSINYRPGTRVQNVALTGRSGLVVTTGLNVPSVTHDIACMACTAQTSRAPVEASGWSPDPDTQYRWAVYENPDGSTTLAIALYPFYYNSQTSDVLFYQDYTLEIETITTSVAIESLTLDQPVSLPGDPISMTLVVNNDGAAQDVVVKALVKTSAVGDLVGSLPLRNLHDLSGQAWVDLAWDTADGTSGGQAPGDYLVEIELMDMAGNVLDKAARNFQLGITSGQVTRLSATPELFNVGDVISISMTFSNIGSVPITGTAIIQVQTADALTLTTEFTHSLSNLAVGRARILTGTWDTTKVSEGAYRVLGYVLYDSTASTPMTATVSTPMAALSIVKTAPITVTAGELFTYTLVVYDAGNIDVTDVTITDALPAHTSFVSADSGGALLAGDIVQWKGLAIRAGSSRRVRFVVRASSPLTDGIVIVNEHYGVSCTEGASDRGSPAGTTVESGPTMVALSSIDARLARKPAWGVALLLALGLAVGLLTALRRQHRHSHSPDEC
ncbi:MAG: DUF11 domain-containing protein [Thermoflexales bacterium]|nr:DUF11 domain-containing protein [Thermoflexales bacterium]